MEFNSRRGGNASPDVSNREEFCSSSSRPSSAAEEIDLINKVLTEINNDDQLRIAAAAEAAKFLSTHKENSFDSLDQDSDAKSVATVNNSFCALPSSKTSEENFENNKSLVDSISNNNSIVNTSYTDSSCDIKTKNCTNTLQTSPLIAPCDSSSPNSSDNIVDKNCDQNSNVNSAIPSEYLNGRNSGSIKTLTLRASSLEDHVENERTSHDVEKDSTQPDAHSKQQFIEKDHQQNCLSENEPVAEKPLNLEKEPVAKQPLSSEKEPVTEQPLSLEKEPVAEQPLSSEKEPVAEQPLSLEEEPVAEQSLSLEKEPVAEQPLNLEKEPVAEQSLSLEKEPVAEKHHNLEIESVKGCNAKKTLESQVVHGDSSLSSPASSVIVDPALAALNPLSVDLSLVKTEPLDDFDTESYDGSSIAGPLEIIPVKEETVEQTEVISGIVVESGLVKMEHFPDEGESSVLPEVRFKINEKVKVYSREQVHAAKLMSQSTLAAVVDMDMFNNVARTMPRVTVPTLDSFASCPNSAPHFDRPMLCLFFKKYGSTVDEWKTHFKYPKKHKHYHSKGRDREKSSSKHSKSKKEHHHRKDKKRGKKVIETFSPDGELVFVAHKLEYKDDNEKPKDKPNDKSHKSSHTKKGTSHDSKKKNKSKAIITDDGSDTEAAKGTSHDSKKKNKPKPIITDDGSDSEAAKETSHDSMKNNKSKAIITDDGSDTEAAKKTAHDGKKKNKSKAVVSKGMSDSETAKGTSHDNKKKNKSKAIISDDESDSETESKNSSASKFEKESLHSSKDVSLCKQKTSDHSPKSPRDKYFKGFLHDEKQNKLEQLLGQCKVLKVKLQPLSPVILHEIEQNDEITIGEALRQQCEFDLSYSSSSSKESSLSPSDRAPDSSADDISEGLARSASPRFAGSVNSAMDKVMQNALSKSKGISEPNKKNSHVDGGKTISRSASMENVSNESSFVSSADKELPKVDSHSSVMTKMCEDISDDFGNDGEGFDDLGSSVVDCKRAADECKVTSGEEKASSAESGSKESIFDSLSKSAEMPEKTLVTPDFASSTPDSVGGSTLIECAGKKVEVGAKKPDSVSSAKVMPQAPNQEKELPLPEKEKKSNKSLLSEYDRKMIKIYKLKKCYVKLKNVAKRKKYHKLVKKLLTKLSTKDILNSSGSGVLNSSKHSTGSSISSVTVFGKSSDDKESSRQKELDVVKTGAKLERKGVSSISKLLSSAKKDRKSKPLNTEERSSEKKDISTSKVLTGFKIPKKKESSTPRSFQGPPQHPSIVNRKIEVPKTYREWKMQKEQMKNMAVNDRTKPPQTVVEGWTKRKASRYSDDKAGSGVSKSPQTYASPFDCSKSGASPASSLGSAHDDVPHHAIDRMQVNSPASFNKSLLIAPEGSQMDWAAAIASFQQNVGHEPNPNALTHFNSNAAYPSNPDMYQESMDQSGSGDTEDKRFHPPVDWGSMSYNPSRNDESIPFISNDVQGKRLNKIPVIGSEIEPPHSGEDYAIDDTSNEGEPVGQRTDNSLYDEATKQLLDRIVSGEAADNLSVTVPEHAQTRALKYLLTLDRRGQHKFAEKLKHKYYGAKHSYLAEAGDRKHSSSKMKLYDTFLATRKDYYSVRDYLYQQKKLRMVAQKEYSRKEIQKEKDEIEEEKAEEEIMEERENEETQNVDEDTPYSPESDYSPYSPTDKLNGESKVQSFTESKPANDSSNNSSHNTQAPVVHSDLAKDKVLNDNPKTSSKSDVKRGDKDKLSQLINMVMCNVRPEEEMEETPISEFANEILSLRSHSSKNVEDSSRNNPYEGLRNPSPTRDKAYDMDADDSPLQNLVPKADAKEKIRKTLSGISENQANKCLADSQQPLEQARKSEPERENLHSILGSILDKYSEELNPSVKESGTDSSPITSAGNKGVVSDRSRLSDLSHSTVSTDESVDGKKCRSRNLSPVCGQSKGASSPALPGNQSPSKISTDPDVTLSDGTQRQKISLSQNVKEDSRSTTTEKAPKEQSIIASINSLCNQVAASTGVEEFLACKKSPNESGAKLDDQSSLIGEVPLSSSSTNVPKSDNISYSAKDGKLLPSNCPNGQPPSKENDALLFTKDSSASLSADKLPAHNNASRVPQSTLTSSPSPSFSKDLASSQSPVLANKSPLHPNQSSSCPSHSAPSSQPPPLPSQPPLLPSQPPPLPTQPPPLPTQPPPLPTQPPPLPSQPPPLPTQPPPLPSQPLSVSPTQPPLPPVPPPEEVLPPPPDYDPLPPPPAPFFAFPTLRKLAPAPTAAKELPMQVDSSSSDSSSDDSLSSADCEEETPHSKTSLQKLLAWKSNNNNLVQDEEQGDADFLASFGVICVSPSSKVDSSSKAVASPDENRLDFTPMIVKHASFLANDAGPFRRSPEIDSHTSVPSNAKKLFKEEDILQGIRPESQTTQSPPNDEGDVSRYYRTVPLAQSLLDKHDIPFVGLQYVVEVQQGSDLKSCYFVCALCSKKMSSTTLVAHIKSVPHRLKFAEHHCPSLNKKYGSIQLKDWTVALVKEFSNDMNKVATETGKFQMAVCGEDSMNPVLATIKDNVGNIEKFRAYMRDSPVCRTQQAPSSPGMSGLPDFLKQKLKQGLKKDSPQADSTTSHGLKRREDSPEVIALDGPITKKSRWEDAGPNTVERVGAFKKDFDNFYSCHTEKEMYYKKNPESHPEYNSEWKLFWERRYQELVSRGVDPNKHDFKPEWVLFWNDRMKDIFRGIVEKKRESLMKKHRISSEDLEERRPVSPWEESGSRAADQAGPSVLNTLNALMRVESHLGAFGPAIKTLLLKSMHFEKEGAKVLEIFFETDNLTLIKLSQDKLKAMMSDSLDGHLKDLLIKAVDGCKWLIGSVESHRTSEEYLGLDMKVIVAQTRGMDTVQIAQHIALALLKIGKANVSEDDLQKILLAVSASHAKMMLSDDHQSGPPNVADGLVTSTTPSIDDHQVASNASKPLFPSAAAAPPPPQQKTMTVDSKSSNTSGALGQLMSAYDDIENPRDMDKLSLEDLVNLLSNFKELASDEKKALTTYLKRLEATDLRKVTKLREMVQKNMKAAATEKSKPKDAKQEKDDTDGRQSADNRPSSSQSVHSDRPSSHQSSQGAAHQPPPDASHPRDPKMDASREDIRDSQYNHSRQPGSSNNMPDVNYQRMLGVSPVGCADERPPFGGPHPQRDHSQERPNPHDERYPMREGLERPEARRYHEHERMDDRFALHERRGHPFPPHDRLDSRGVADRPPVMDRGAMHDRPPIPSGVRDPHLSREGYPPPYGRVGYPDEPYAYDRPSHYDDYHRERYGDERLPPPHYRSVSPERWRPPPHNAPHYGQDPYHGEAPPPPPRGPLPPHYRPPGPRGAPPQRGRPNMFYR